MPCLLACGGSAHHQDAAGLAFPSEDRLVIALEKLSVTSETFHTLHLLQEQQRCRVYSLAVEVHIIRTRLGWPSHPRIVSPLPSKSSPSLQKRSTLCTCFKSSRDAVFTRLRWKCTSSGRGWVGLPIRGSSRHCPRKALRHFRN